MNIVHKRYQMRTPHNGTKNIFLGFFLREASRNEECNAVAKLESHNVYLFFLGSANQKSNRGVGSKTTRP